jgi:hypothetical protein
VLAGLWIWGVSAGRVKVAAFACAERLVAATEALREADLHPNSSADVVFRCPNVQVTDVGTTSGSK